MIVTGVESWATFDGKLECMIYFVDKFNRKIGHIKYNFQTKQVLSIFIDNIYTNEEFYLLELEEIAKVFFDNNKVWPYDRPVLFVH